MNIDISLDLYKIFCTVVKSGNMSLAAKELYISQPAVSMAIRQLETRLGSTLLIRTTKGVHTTPEGSMIYDYVSQALNLINVAEQKYLEMATLEMGDIKIGASDSIISHYLIPYLEKYNELHANINIKVTNRTTYGTTQLLKHGKVDLGFVNLPLKNDDSLEVVEILTIHDRLYGGSRYKDLAKTGLALTDIHKYPLLLLENDSSTRQFLNHYTEEHGIVLKPIFELGSAELLHEFAAINLGLTVLIKEFVKERPGLDIFEIPLIPQPQPRSVGMIKLKNVALSFAARQFVELLNEKL